MVESKHIHVGIVALNEIVAARSVANSSLDQALGNMPYALGQNMGEQPSGRLKSIVAAFSLPGVFER